MDSKKVNQLINHIGFIKKYSITKLIIFKFKLLLEGLIAWIYCNLSCAEIIQEKSKVLVLTRSEKSYTHNNFIKVLNGEVSFNMVTQHKGLSIISTKQFAKPLINLSIKLYLYSAYATYLIKKYSPKVIITESNGSILSSILKEQCALMGIKVVHIAHSVATLNYRMFSLIDYDIYMVYGKSSIEYISQRDRIFGQCQYLICGSWIIQDRLRDGSDLDLNSIKGQVFLLLGSGPSYEQRKETEKYYDLIIKFVEKTGANLIFKPHPRSDLLLWKKLVANLDKKRFLITNTLSKDMQGKVKIAFCSYTNAILDVSSLSIVPILISSQDAEDLFEYRNFFGKYVNSPDEIECKIDFVIDNYDYFSQKTLEFSDYHLSTIKDSKKFILEQIKSLVSQQH